MLNQNLSRDVVEFLIRKSSQSVQMNELMKTLSNTKLRECSFDHDVASRSKGDRTWETSFRTLIDQFQWFCLQHEAGKFLIGLCFEDDWFFVEPIIKPCYMVKDL